MKIFITGGCGFLGYNLVKRLITNRKYKVYVIDNLSRLGSKKNLNLIKNNILFKNLDLIKDLKQVEDFIINIKPDVIIHLAGQVAMSKSLKMPFFDFQTNALSTVRIIELIRKYIPKCQLLFSSTNKVYGDLSSMNYVQKKTRFELKQQRIDEKTPINLTTPYGCSKGVADIYIIEYAKIYNLNFTVFRHSTIYGSNQNFDFDQGWISWFCKKVYDQKFNNGKIFSINGNGKQVRDVLNVKDVVDLYVKSIKNKKKIVGEVYNIGGGYENSLSILELIAILEKILNLKSKYYFVKKRISDQNYFVSNNTKIYKAIKWKPKINKIKGIKEILYSFE